MANAFYDRYHGAQQPQQPQQAPQQLNNPMNLFQRLMQFKQSLTVDPKQQVMNMLTGGQISQEQLNQAAQEANQLYGLFKF